MHILVMIHKCSDCDFMKDDSGIFVRLDLNYQPLYDAIFAHSYLTYLEAMPDSRDTYAQWYIIGMSLLLSPVNDFSCILSFRAWCCSPLPLFFNSAFSITFFQVFFLLSVQGIFFFISSIQSCLRLFKTFLHLCKTQ